jgi:3'(2'), 5'-bisphosphate nucleotidase
LTEADQASSEFLEDALRDLSPKWPAVSEESTGVAMDVLINSECFWLVDPLDGTKEFLKGTGEFTVNIALIQNRQPVMGVVHAPASGLTYFAERGSGAFRVQNGDPYQRIQARRADGAAMEVVASRDHAGPMIEMMLSRMPGANRRSVGSSLKFCLIAEGKADLYLRDGPTMEWDTAAAQCVVEAAGGVVCSLDGQTLGYGKPGLRNPHILTRGDPGFEWEKLFAAQPVLG